MQTTKSHLFSKCAAVAAYLCPLLMTSSAWCGEITGSLSCDGWWMRPGDGTYMEWDFAGLSAATLGDPFTVDMNLYVTHKVNGGSGYSTEVKVYVTNPVTLVQLSYDVWLQNLLPGTNPIPNPTPPPPLKLPGTNRKYSHGYGYPAAVSFSVPASILTGSTGLLRVRVERKPGYAVTDGTDNALWYPHVGDSYNQTGVTLAPGPAPPPVNQTPVANAGGDQQAELIGATVAVNLNGSYWDDDLPDPPAAVTTTWSKVSGPGTVTFGDASALSTTATFNTQGTYTLNLKVDDSALIDNDTMVVEVKVADIVTATINSITPTDGDGKLRFHKGDSTTTISFTGSATDSSEPPHNIQSWQWRSSIDGGFATTQNPTKKPSDFSVGTHVIYLSATCTNGSTSSEVEYSKKLVISDKPTLTILSAVMQWVTGDEINHNARAVLYVRITNADVILDEVHTQLPNADDWDEYTDFAADESRYSNLVVPIHWGWCPTDCLKDPLDLDLTPKKYSFTVTADFEDTHGYEFTLTDSVDRTLSVPLWKQRDYTEAYDMHQLAEWAEISIILAHFAPAARRRAKDCCRKALDPWEPDFAYGGEVHATVPIVDPGPMTQGDVEAYEKTCVAMHDALSASASQEALYATIPKMMGAALDQDFGWLSTHSLDALRFSVYLAEDSEKVAHSMNALRRWLKANAPVTVAVVQAYLDDLAASGQFPDDALAIFAQMGLEQSEIDELLARALATDPEDVVAAAEADTEEELAALAVLARGEAIAEWPCWPDDPDLYGWGAIAITSPREDSRVRGQVTVDVMGWTNQADWMEVFQVELPGVLTIQYPDFPLIWDTVGLADGEYDISLSWTLSYPPFPPQGPVDTITVTVDNTPPMITITSPTPSSYSEEGDPIPLVYSVQDGDGHPRVKYLLLNGEPLTAGSIPRVPGSYELSITAVDLAGNVGYASVSFEVTAGPPPIPTTSVWGLAVLALLLLIGAKVYYGRWAATS
ncbi:MAG: hypothetical protein JSU63_20240 [Phycisphaerales bacterium]|nr:MAG: hypothetical protein JSU63_20240 [Phycisphaerales bacterium]